MEFDRREDSLTEILQTSWRKQIHWFLGAGVSGDCHSWLPSQKCQAVENCTLVFFCYSYKQCKDLLPPSFPAGAQISHLKQQISPQGPNPILCIFFTVCNPSHLQSPTLEKNENSSRLQLLRFLGYSAHSYICRLWFHFSKWESWIGIKDNFLLLL